MGCVSVSFDTWSTLTISKSKKTAESHQENPRNAHLQVQCHRWTSCDLQRAAEGAVYGNRERWALDIDQASALVLNIDIRNGHRTRRYFHCGWGGAGRWEYWWYASVHHRIPIIVLTSFTGYTFEGVSNMIIENGLFICAKGGLGGDWLASTGASIAIGGKFDSLLFLLRIHSYRLTTGNMFLHATNIDFKGGEYFAVSGDVDIYLGTSLSSCISSFFLTLETQINFKFHINYISIIMMHLNTLIKMNLPSNNQTEPTKSILREWEQESISR